LMPRQVNRADDAVFDRAARGFGHNTLFARQASRGWPSPVGAGFQRLARPCRSRFAGEPGYPFNAAVPVEKRSPASRLLQIRVDAKAGEPCWR
jgi:hypothetical protein